MGHEKMQDLCRIHLINHLQAARSQVTGYATLEHLPKTNPCKGAGWPPPLWLDKVGKKRVSWGVRVPSSSARK